jgi:hypothetical protein
MPSAADVTGCSGRSLAERDHSPLAEPPVPSLLLIAESDCVIDACRGHSGNQ